MSLLAEKQRLKTSKENNPWKIWGPYLTDRQWGTVREDYSPDGSAWEFISHESARSKAYRWGEEGIGGISDNKSILCFALGMWNGKDPIIKERLFGLSGNEGNHGEDVKELYYYLDSAPSHSYMKMLYKYPQVEYPYTNLVSETRNRTRLDPEFEIWETGVFKENRYFDVFIEYAKGDVNDVLIKITVHNRASEVAPITLLPTIWFRNTWSWGCGDYKPLMSASSDRAVDIKHEEFGNYTLHSEHSTDFLFCDNETNCQKLFNSPNTTEYTKDGINEYIIAQNHSAINPRQEGTKASAYYHHNIPAGESITVNLRLTDKNIDQAFSDFEEIFKQRIRETDEFYEEIQRNVKDAELRSIQRQAFAGMMWGKQFYYFNVAQWLDGDAGQCPPKVVRWNDRNKQWRHLNNSNIISMPDKWEYPWYAAWDLAFHCIPIARIDPDFAKRQLTIMVREYYMHPNGQIPAYEWNFSDVNPPVHAWATWRVYEIDKEMNEGKGDLDFLERVYHKLLLNFTWWVNRKDSEGNNVFEGGFLGLDNIGVFDRSQPLPTGGKTEQSDGTSWMAMYALNMLQIATELSLTRPIYQDAASKFFEHFLFIANASVNIGDAGVSLWNEEDEFFYDLLHMPNGFSMPLKVRSIVGLIPMYAVHTISSDILKKLPDFRRRMEWVLTNRPDLASLVSRWYEFGKGETRLLSLLRGSKMKALLRRMLDESEFLSEYGIRALSKYHKDFPYEFHYNNNVFTVTYQPAESESGLFGGNSNWRGPIWFPVNYMLIESLLKFHGYYGDDFLIEYPTGSGTMLTIKDVANELRRRLLKIFVRNEEGKRPMYGDNDLLQNDPHFRDHILFYEFFHGDNGTGLGASHQTGWTGLVADIIHELAIEDVSVNRKKTVDNSQISV
ncbi:MAG TPA: glucosidase [Cytophagaceae bacterium]